MQKNKKILFTSLLLLILTTPNISFALPAAQITSPYVNYFNNLTAIVETGSTAESANAEWWLNSGAKLIPQNNRASTIQGDLGSTDPWRILYNKNNPIDTDLGLHPQNLFRLLTRSKWQNAMEEAYFIVKKDNLSASSNRNQSNALLLMSRYQDSQNLYYTGVRVDGSAIIKKKKNGTYYTLAEVKNIYPGTYNKNTSPNLLPKNKWIGLRSEIKNQADGSVKINLYLDKGWSGIWQLVASATDDGKSFGGTAITNLGYSGIRTDFMDVEFENFRLKNI